MNYLRPLITVALGLGIFGALGILGALTVGVDALGGDGAFPVAVIDGSLDIEAPAEGANVGAIPAALCGACGGVVALMAVIGVAPGVPTPGAPIVPCTLPDTPIPAPTASLVITSSAIWDAVFLASRGTPKGPRPLPRAKPRP